MQMTCGRTALLCALLLPGIWGNVNADVGKQRLGTAFSQCTEAARGAIEHSECLSDEAQRQELRMTQNYHKLQGRLQGEARGQLIAAQRAWQLSREHDAEVDATLEQPGQIGNLQGDLDDLLRLTARANQLQVWLDRLE